MKLKRMAILTALVALLMVTTSLRAEDTGTPVPRGTQTTNQPTGVGSFEGFDPPPSAATTKKPPVATDEFPVSFPATDTPTFTPPGPAGPKGDKGDKGDPGGIGPKGGIGDRGATGKTGKTGHNGTNGRNGQNGPGENVFVRLIGHYFNKHHLVGLDRRVTKLEEKLAAPQKQPTQPQSTTQSSGLMPAVYGAGSSSKSANPPHNNFGWLILLIIWLVIIFAVCILLRRHLRRLWDLLRNWISPPPPPPPAPVVARNTAGATLHGVPSGRSTPYLTCTGRSVLELLKGARNVSRHGRGKCTFAPQNGSLNIGDCHYGEEITFCIQIKNPSHTEVDLHGMLIWDVMAVPNSIIIPLDVPGQPGVTAGMLIFGGEDWIDSKDEAFVDRFTKSGQTGQTPIDIGNEIVEFIPARDATGPGTINLIYKVRVIGPHVAATSATGTGTSPIV